MVEELNFKCLDDFIIEPKDEPFIFDILDKNLWNNKKFIRKYAKEKGKSQDFVVRYSHIGCVVSNCSLCRRKRGGDVKEKKKGFKNNEMRMEIKSQLSDPFSY